MSNKTYILCPGQGAQVVGMGKDFYNASPAARAIFDRTNEVLGTDITSLCFAGPDEQLQQTNVSQPAIYVTGIAAFHSAQEAGLIDPATVTAYAGLSLGEYTALHLAGVFTFEQGLKLVQARGTFMQEAAVASPSGMVAVMGADESAITALCAEAAQGDVLVPANFNAPGQIAISGTLAACERGVKLAESKGFKAIPLKVAGAFHSPLMQAAADRMKVELDQVEFKPASTPVYSNVNAALHGTDSAAIKSLLIDQIVKPVRWEQTMQTLVAGGEARFIEIAPGRVLTGLLKKINRRLPVESFATAEALTGVKA